MYQKTFSGNAVTTGTSRTYGETMLADLKLLEKNYNIHLSKFQKLLLSEIGTVEQLLSILVDSPITVDLVRLDERDDKIIRYVVLRDAERKPLLLATTRYERNLLPAQLYDDLKSGRLGIGSAIMHYGLETRRRIIKIGYDEKTKQLFREYEIIKEKTVIFSIREDFSIDSFRK